MITAKEQEALLLRISAGIKRKISCFAIGGTAMMFYGFKDTTLDIDLVFLNEKDRREFIKSAGELGYKKIESREVYASKENQPVMMTLGKERFDLFLPKVISFVFSENMQMRCRQTHEFGKNLTVKIADYHDIMLMKCATDRIKDKDDAKKIIESSEIDWSVMINEAKSQVMHGQEKKAIFELGCFFEELKKELKVSIPEKVLAKIYSLLREETKDWKQ